MSNPNHDPSNGEFTSGPGGPVTVGSKKFKEVLNNPNAKSHEVAGANAKEQFRLRKEIDKASREGNTAKLVKLQITHDEVRRVGEMRHQSMPVHGVMLNTSRSR